MKILITLSFILCQVFISSPLLLPFELSKTMAAENLPSGLRKKLAAVNILQFLSFVEPFELPF